MTFAIYSGFRDVWQVLVLSLRIKSVLSLNHCYKPQFSVSLLDFLILFGIRLAIYSIQIRAQFCESMLVVSSLSRR